MQPSVLVTGASSQLGVFLLPGLRAAGYRVTALSREAPAEPLEVAAGLHWVHPDSVLADGCRYTQAGTTFLVSCAPLELTIALVNACSSVERVVAFSTSSVLTKADSSDRSESELIRSIAGRETELRKRCSAHGIALLLLRPTLIYGCGMDSNISLLARLGRSLGFVPLAGSAAGLRQPVHAGDLADLAITALDCPRPQDFDTPACGGSTLSYREMAAAAMTGLTGRCRTLSVPAPVLALLVRVLSVFRPWQSLNAEMVHRQSQDLVFDDSAVRAALDYDPRPFDPTPADFEVPPAARTLQLPIKS